MLVVPGGAQVPWFVTPLCVGSGIALVAAGLPLARRRVPPNALYGVRLPSTMRDEEAWYEVNERAGRDLIAIGAGFLLCYLAAHWLGAGWDPAVRVLVPVVLLVAALVVETVVIFRAAERAARRR